MNYKNIFTFIALICLFSSRFLHTDFYRASWAYLLLVPVLYLLNELRKSYGNLIAVTAGFFLTHSILATWTDLFFYENLNKAINNFLSYSYAQTLCIMIFSCLFLLHYKSRNHLIDLYCGFNAFFILASSFFKEDPYGITGNIGIDSIFLLVWLPMVVSRSKRVLLALMMALVIIVGGTVTMSVGLIFGVLAYIFFTMSKKAKLISLFICAMCLGVVILLLPYINTGNRFINWWLFIQYGFQNMDILTGLGGGSFWFMGPLIQSSHYPANFRGFVFAHNEFIQIFLEYGIVALLLVCIVIFRAFKSIKSLPLKLSCTLYLYTWLTWIPLRFPSTMLLGLILLSEIYKEKKCTTFTRYLDEEKTLIKKQQFQSKQDITITQ